MRALGLCALCALCATTFLAAACASDTVALDPVPAAERSPPDRGADLAIDGGVADAGGHRGGGADGGSTFGRSDAASLRADGGASGPGDLGVEAASCEGEPVPPFCMTCDPADPSICETRWVWDGSECLPLLCGTYPCSGAATREECLAAHRSCEPELCRSSGGEWIPWLEHCGHHVCGEPAPQICESPTPACNCGPSRQFVPEVGCAAAPLCEQADVPARTAEDLCRGSGGVWGGASCCPTECGRPCPLACASPSCACGPLEVFDPSRGCVHEERCHLRLAGEACDLSTDADTACAPGLVCCGGGIRNDQGTCEPPCCGAGCAGGCPLRP